MLQRSEEWFRVRAGKITASRVAAALGLDPYLTRPRLWRQLTGVEQPAPPNARMEAGTEAEPYALHDYELITGHLVEPVGFVHHPTIPWLGASPDGFVNDASLVEIKCPDPEFWKARTEVPDHYYAQIQAQLQCTGRSHCDYFQWNQNTGEYVLLPVWRDDAWWAWAYPHLKEFWQCVCDKIPPARAKPKREMSDEREGTVRVDLQKSEAHEREATTG